MFEVEATIRVPAMLVALPAMEELFNVLGDDTSASSPLCVDTFDPKAQLGLQALRMAAGSIKTRPVPLLFGAALTPEIPFFASLPQQHLRCEINNLQREATVIGVVSRLLPEGQVHEVFGVVLAMSALSQSLPNVSANERQKYLEGMAKANAGEILQGPAVILTPVAVFR